jgi:hypothetical protein
MFSDMSALLEGSPERITVIDNTSGNKWQIIYYVSDEYALGKTGRGEGGPVTEKKNVHWCR